MLTSQNNKTVFYILIAFLFSFSIRLIWVYQFNDISEFQYNDQFMINTNDGYFWAQGARDIISGQTHLSNLSPIQSAPAQLTAFLYKYLPFSFESLIFYMPAFFASLIVIPIILIARSIDKLEVGFIAALLGSIAWSYYNRTMVGYYDTDFLNIVFPTILLWSIIWAIRTKEDKYLLFTAFDILAYRWWYPQSYSLEFAFFAMVSLYLIFEIFKVYITKKNLKKMYENKEIFYTIQLLSIMLLSMNQLEITFRFMLVFGYFMLFRQVRWHKHLYIMSLMVCILFISSGGLGPIIGQLNNYVFKDIVTSSGDDLKLHFFTVMQTIKEADTIPLETIANRISGSMITFILSLVGYIWLMIRYPIMLFGLPMVGLGLLSYSGGLRFTIYAIPIFSLGVAFLIMQLSEYMKKNIIKYLFIVGATVAILVPNIKHIIKYQIPTVFFKSEVDVLSHINQIGSRDDYMVSWWDYGYPIRYYANLNTLSDGGKHSGSVNFPTSFALTNKQDVAAKMLRLDVEYTEKRYALDKEDKVRGKTNIENMILDYSFDDANDFLLNLKRNIKLPSKTRDIYLYLPKRMLNILPTISLFSNIDLMTGKNKDDKFFYFTEGFDEKKNSIALGNDIFIDKRTGQIQIQNQRVTINNFMITSYDSNKQLNKNLQVIDKDGLLNVIFMKDYNSFLIVDNELYNSMYVQLFVLENFDTTYYDPISLTPLAKVYRLKI